MHTTETEAKENWKEQKKRYAIITALEQKWEKKTTKRKRLIAKVQYHYIAIEKATRKSSNKANELAKKMSASKEENQKSR